LGPPVEGAVHPSVITFLPLSSVMRLRVYVSSRTVRLCQACTHGEPASVSVKCFGFCFLFPVPIRRALGFSSPAHLPQALVVSSHFLTWALHHLVLQATVSSLSFIFHFSTGSATATSLLVGVFFPLSLARFGRLPIAISQVHYMCRPVLHRPVVCFDWAPSHAPACILPLLFLLMCSGRRDLRVLVSLPPHNLFRAQSATPLGASLGPRLVPE